MMWLDSHGLYTFVLLLLFFLIFYSGAREEPQQNKLKNKIREKIKLLLWLTHSHHEPWFLFNACVFPYVIVSIYIYVYLYLCVYLYLYLYLAIYKENYLMVLRYFEFALGLRNNPPLVCFESLQNVFGYISKASGYGTYI